MKTYAASGSCFDEELEIVGSLIDGKIFVSKDFTGSMSDRGFWTKLAEFASNIHRFVVLKYGG